MKKGIIAILLALGFYGMSCADDALRTWTSSDGRKIEASLESASDTQAKLILASGKSADVPFSKLSQADIDYIKEWQDEQEIRNKNFSIEVGKVSAGLIKTFISRNSTRIKGFSGLGKTESISIYTNTTESLYSVKVSEDHLILEVKAEMVPPINPGAMKSFSLTVENLILIYEERDGSEGRVKPGPRWADGADTKMGKNTIFLLEEQKTLKFGVGYVIPKDARAKALEYESGLLRLYVPIP